MLDSEGVIRLAKEFPNTRAGKFLDWFTYSDTSIDGQSKKKAYTLLRKLNQNRVCAKFAHTAEDGKTYHT